MNLKFTIIFVLANFFLSMGLISVEANAADTITQERYDKVCRWGFLNPPECKKQIIKSETSKASKNIPSSKSSEEQKVKIDSDCRWGLLNPPKCRGKDSRVGTSEVKNTYEKKQPKSFEEDNHNISVYTGTFDVIDKEGDDQTTLIGIEHKNKDLFRDTWIGRFSPTTGAFVTGKSSVYIYTGIEADYNLGPINISPSFAPGYYEAGDGKNLGSALEFKSEIKIGIDLFKNANLGYSYSHISNNDWGDVNSGTDNQSITFSKKF